MNRLIMERVEKVADYILKTKDTIRNTAIQFGVSKSTIHKDIQERLKEYDIEKYKRVEAIFQYHIDVRHILGGQSTKIKYTKLKQSDEG